MRSQAPKTFGKALCWGDPRPGNIIYRDGEVAAVLDWELAHIGAPEGDLAYFLLVDEVVAELNEVPRLPAFLMPPKPSPTTSADIAASTRSRISSHHASPADAAMLVLTVRLSPAELIFPPNYLTNNIPTRRLAELLHNHARQAKEIVMTEVVLTAADEYLCHQTVTSFEQVTTTDRNWTKRVHGGLRRLREVMVPSASASTQPGCDGCLRRRRRARSAMEHPRDTRAAARSRQHRGWSRGLAGRHTPPNRIILADNELDVAFDVTLKATYADRRLARHAPRQGNHRQPHDSILPAWPARGQVTVEGAPISSIRPAPTPTRTAPGASGQ